MEIRVHAKMRQDQFDKVTECLFGRIEGISVLNQKDDIEFVIESGTTTSKIRLLCRDVSNFEYREGDAVDWDMQVPPIISRVSVQFGEVGDEPVRIQIDLVNGADSLFKGRFILIDCKDAMVTSATREEHF